MIAQELPKDQAEKARKRKEKKAQKLQSKIKEKTLFYGNYVILITSLGVEYDRKEILSNYRSIWRNSDIVMVADMDYYRKASISY